MYVLLKRIREHTHNYYRKEKLFKICDIIYLRKNLRQNNIRRNLFFVLQCITQFKNVNTFSTKYSPN